MSVFIMKSQQRRDQILQAALGVFSEYGYEKTSIARVCEALGIARGTLYQYFRDKQALFRELIEDRIEALRPLIRPSDWGGPGHGSLGERLFERHRLIFAEIHQHRDLFRVLLREGQARNPETEELIRAVAREIVGMMRTEFESATRAGLCHCEDPDFTAVYLLGGILHLIEWELFIASRPSSPEQLARRVTDLQLRVLRAEAAPAQSP
jgi:AcrR family transcriptional regulator